MRQCRMILGSKEQTAVSDVEQETVGPESRQQSRQRY